MDSFTNSHFRLKSVQLLFVILSYLQQSYQQVFWYSCNDRIIIGRPSGTPYCATACSDFVNSNDYTCNDDGICVCNFPSNFPCDDFMTYSRGLCSPAPPTSPPTEDPNWSTECETLCKKACPTGGTQVCREDYEAEESPTTGDFARICTCACPPNGCNPFDNTTTTTEPVTTTTEISTTTSTMATINVTTVAVLSPFIKSCAFLLKGSSKKLMLLNFLYFIYNLLSNALIFHFSFVLGYFMKNFIYFTHTEDIGGYSDSPQHVSILFDTSSN